MLIKGKTSGKENTVFSKDRGYATGTTADNNFLRIGINDADKVSVTLAQYKPTTEDTKTSTGTVVAGTWKYVVPASKC